MFGASSVSKVYFKLDFCRRRLDKPSNSVILENNIRTGYQSNKEHDLELNTVTKELFYGGCETLDDRQAYEFKAFY